ncbi:putative spermidine/putrescine transport system permease protein [Aquamicrobium terrae]
MRQVNAVMGLLSAGALLFLLAPIVTILPIALSSGDYISYPLPGLSLRWLEQIAMNPGWREALGNSIFIALSSAALASLLGTLAAVGLVQAAPRAARSLRSLLMLPVAIPSVVLGLGLYFFLARVSLLSTYAGLILAHAVISFPLVMVVVGASLATTDLVVIRAAQSLGAGWRMIFLDVLVPMLYPAILAGFILAFLNSFDEVIVTMFIAGPEQNTVPRVLFANLRDRLDPSVVAVTVLMLLLSAGLGLLLQLLARWAQRRPAEQ